MTFCNILAMPLAVEDTFFHPCIVFVMFNGFHNISVITGKSRCDRRCVVLENSLIYYVNWTQIGTYISSKWDAHP